MTQTTNNVDYKKLGLQIKQVRLNHGLTQEALAEYVGCNVSHISNIENSYTKASLNILLGIANALNTSIDYLLADQYVNLSLASLALDKEILRAVKDLDDEKKQKILKMIAIM